MFLVARRLLEEGYSRDSVIYVSFENKALYPLNDRLLDEILEYALETKMKKCFLFLDEIQGVRGWERWARSLYDEYKGRIKLVVSGSTSKIMSEDISSLLTGRHVSLKLLPLGFAEFLEFKGAGIPKEPVYSRQKTAEIRGLFSEYMKFGGFPEVSLLEDSMKAEVLRSYYEDILYKDILGKFRIREMAIMENFIKFLFSSISSHFSIKRGVNYLNSVGIRASSRTLLKYTSMLEETFLFFFLPIFSRKVRDILKYPRKVYCVDVGLRNVTNPFSEDFGHVCENIVFLELKRMSFHNPSLSINYWKDEKGDEVDFVIRQGSRVRQLIQVCWKMDQETKGREIGALLKAIKQFGLKEGTVLTGDMEAKERIGGKKIAFMPVYKWLLENGGKNYL